MKITRLAFTQNIHYVHSPTKSQTIRYARTVRRITNKSTRNRVYQRPTFLGVVATCQGKPADGEAITRDIHVMPQGMYSDIFGYSETRNAGKSVRNEDMALFCENQITIQNSLQRYRIWGMFDGHGDWDVALASSRIFETAFRFSLQDAEHASQMRRDGVRWTSYVPAALKRAFRFVDDELMRLSEDSVRRGYDRLNGGCAVVIVVEMGGLFWVANCGDSGATAFVTSVSASSSSSTASNVEETSKVDETSKVEEKTNLDVLNVTTPHTIESERRKIQTVACHHPEYLGGAFSRRIFEPPPGRRKWKGSFIPNKKDIGLETMVWDYFSDELVKTTVTKEDVIAEHVDGDKIVHTFFQSFKSYAQ